MKKKWKINEDEKNGELWKNKNKNKNKNKYCLK
jgi:hypothetical protein